MARLIYAALTSLDGYVADEAGNFDWAVPDEEVHAYINDLERPVGTYLYGRRMYETMAGWETPGAMPDRSPAMLEFARIWQAADKIVYSRTLRTVSTARTRLEREFDPEAVRELKAGAAQDIGVGGPSLAAHAIRAGLVDEYQVFVAPIIVGSGNPYQRLSGRAMGHLCDQCRWLEEAAADARHGVRLGSGVVARRGQPDVQPGRWTDDHGCRRQRWAGCGAGCRPSRQFGTVVPGRPADRVLWIW